MNRKLEEVIKSVELIARLIPLEGLIVVLDHTRKVCALQHHPAVNLGLKVGDYIAEEEPNVQKVLKTKQDIEHYLPKEVLGVEIEGRMVPVLEGSELVGILIYSVNLEEKKKLRNEMQELQSDIEGTNAHIDNIVQGISEIVQGISSIEEKSKGIENQVAMVTSVVDLIQKNASYSNILALNASIESARAGQAGKGFAVVAEEMGKFSKQSGESAKKINVSLKEMVASVEEILQTIKSSAEIAGEQSQRVNEITQSFASVTNLAQKMANEIEHRTRITNMK